MITRFDECLQVVVERFRQIDEHEQEIARRQETIRIIRDNLEDDLIEVADQLESAELMELGHLLYWHTNMHTDSIARVLQVRGSGSVAKAVGGLPSGEYCQWCRKEFFYESRSHRSNRLSAKRREERFGLERGRLCDECRQLSWEESRAREQQRQQALAEKVAAYRAMPYKRYLKTEHWQKVREYALKRSGFRCQLCNASGLLDVHHRTYERRGEEDAGDVIVLCRDCHNKFHDKT